MNEMITRLKFLIFPFRLTFSHAKDDVITCKALKVCPFFEHYYLQSFVNKLAAIPFFSVSFYVYISLITKKYISIFISTEISCVIYWHKYYSWLAVITDAFHTSACKRSRDIFLWNSMTRARIVYINKDQWKLLIVSLVINFENVVRAKTLTYHILRPEEIVGMPRWLYPAVLPIPYRNPISKKQDIIYYLSFIK